MFGAIIGIGHARLRYAIDIRANHDWRRAVVVETALSCAVRDSAADVVGSGTGGIAVADRRARTRHRHRRMGDGHPRNSLLFDLAPDASRTQVMRYLAITM